MGYTYFFQLGTIYQTISEFSLVGLHPCIFCVQQIVTFMLKCGCQSYNIKIFKISCFPLTEVNIIFSGAQRTVKEVQKLLSKQLRILKIAKKFVGGGRNKPFSKTLRRLFLMSLVS
jgi:hypothetical protein